MSSEVFRKTRETEIHVTLNVYGAGEVDAEAQAGGGVRTLRKALELLEGGVWRVILGTMAFRDREKLRKLLSSYGPERVAVDHSQGLVSLRG